MMEAHDTLPKELPKIKPARLAWLGVLIALIVAAVFAIRFVIDRRDKAALEAQSQQEASAPPVVAVAPPKSSGQQETLTLPGSISPMQETALYARISGYLKRWNYDIGSHVDAGQLLGEISAPDVDAQLAQAKASLEQARANQVSAHTNNQLAQATYVRYQGLVATGGVTQQDLDSRQTAAAQADAAEQAAIAAVKSAQANIQQLEAQQGFEKIYAPFSGTVTARNFDVGALISPSDTSVGHELFRVAQTDMLRIWVYVPQSYVTLIKPGQKVYFLTPSNYPGRKFAGVVGRTAGALDMTTRTLRTELDFDNSDGSLWSGMYGQVIFDIQRQTPIYMVPSSALIFNGQGTQVAIVEGSTVHFRKISVGRDLGTDIEVASGLKGDEQVVTDPGERLADGIEVKLVSHESPGGASPTTRPDETRVAQADPQSVSQGDHTK